MKMLALPVVMLAISVAIAAAAVQVPLTVSDRTGAGQPNAFVCSGVPFARGELKDMNISLKGADGREWPSAFRPMVFWPDGSIKWLQIQTRVSLDQGERKTFQLVDGKKAAPLKEAWKIEDEPTGLRVSNGKLDVSFGKSGPDLIQSLQAGKAMVFKADGQPQLRVAIDKSSLGDTDEENWLRDANRSVPLVEATGQLEACYIDERTPFRVVVCQEVGATVDGLRLGTIILRYHLYRFSAEMKVEYTYILEYDTTHQFLRLCSLRFPAALKGCTASVGKAAGATVKIETDNSLCQVATKPDVRVHQIRLAEVTPVNCWIDHVKGGQRTKAGDHTETAGWLNIAGRAFKVAVAAERFKERFPKELAVNANGIIHYLWPSSTGQALDSRNYRWKFTPQGPQGKRWEGPVQGRAEGTATTERLHLDFSGKVSGATLLQRHSKRLLLKASPQRYVGSGVLGPILVRSPEQFPEYEGILEAVLYWIIRSPDTFKWYGLLNDGASLMEFNWAAARQWPLIKDTWMCRGYSGWLMDDGGASWMVMQAFLRSGNDDYFDYVERKMNYVIDVSTIHRDTEPLVWASNHGRPSVGGSRRHNAQHWGDYVSSRGANAFGKHFFYLLTGEPHYLDAIVEGLYFEWIYWSYENWTMVGSLTLGYELFNGMKKSDPLFAARHQARMASLDRARARAVAKGWKRCIGACDSYKSIEQKMSNNPGALLNRATELLNSKVKAETLDFVAELPMTEGVKYYEMAHAPGSPGANQARKFLQTAADEVLAGRGARDAYAHLFQGRAMVMAHDIEPKAGYVDFVRKRLDDMFTKQALQPVSLAGGMKDGAAKLGYMDLWSRIGRYDSIPCQKLEHVNGRILARIPYFLYCLNREEKRD